VAQADDLRTALEKLDDSERKAAIKAFLSAENVKNRFNVAGEYPFVNLFILDKDGRELADNADNAGKSETIDHNFHFRDYFQELIKNEVPTDSDKSRVHVSRWFISNNDHRHKIGVSTRIYSNNDTLLGLLVATFPEGHRLVEFDLEHESNEAFVLCPI